MTRFLMSLEESVELVLYAFSHAKPGDIFVQKSPACTIEVLARAMQEFVNKKGKIQTIGTRHGEKLYETLVSREEMARAKSLKGYYQIPADSRDLNYDKYFSEGESAVSDAADYTSHNTEQLNIEQVKTTLLKLDFIQKALHV
jgi:UDP-glucose 4-epimerase